MTDRAWHAFARTWIDSNGDGVVKDGEPPLRNMEIHVDAVRNRLTAISWPAITNKDGEVQFNVPIPGCSATVFEMYVDVPEGYRITTSPRIAVHPDVWESLGTARVYYFGFVFDQ
ncbi:MAG TPA: hypothetical protein VMN99_11090 [Anaerolineales bacterium]|nr:hypothetical protein [Anaerolineales bacterium]